MHVLATRIVVILFLTQARPIFGNEDRIKLQEKISKECATKYNIKNSFVDTQNVTHDYKCFITCTFTKMGYVDVDGNTNVEGYKVDYNIEDGDLDSIQTCAKDNANADLCEQVYMTQTCNMVHLDAKQ